MRKRSDSGILMLLFAFAVMFFAVTANYFHIAEKQEYVAAASERSELTITSAEPRGTIYDRNMCPLVNAETEYRAVVVPSAVDRETAASCALDRGQFMLRFDKGEPFAFDCKGDTESSAGLTVFEVPRRYGREQLAQHVIGYISDGVGVDGIERAYESILHDENAADSVTYQTDGFGRVLIGEGKTVTESGIERSGVVLTIDRDIQRICEEEGSGIGKGAVVCADVKTGDILAMASFPSYSAENVEEAVSDESCPMINRCLYSYSVGSIFKLVTACEALNEGMGGYIYDCGGSIDADGQIFNCHLLSGHGIQSMSVAMKNSCNTYFISLSRMLDIAAYRGLAYSLRFGRENYLCSGITGSAGVLPTVRQLEIPAELANFSFGQGRLTATPLQITQLVCTIANNGKIPVLRLIRGLTLDGDSISGKKNPQLSQVMSEDSAESLREMMIYAIEDNPNANARAKYVSVGAKTSTAQTGRCDSDGEELCNAWITGFFPADEPQYALTVMIEDGGYGNETAAPIFSAVADRVTREVE